MKCTYRKSLLFIVLFSLHVNVPGDQHRSDERGTVIKPFTLKLSF